MNSQLPDILCELTGARAVVRVAQIQSLWSGYGAILRCELVGHAPVIVKHVQLGKNGGHAHPRGWNSDLSHQRKLRSYRVESQWYAHWARRCDERCRVPRCIASTEIDGDTLFVLEDLDDAGYPGRRRDLPVAQMEICLRWLAWFHATFIGAEPTGLWPQGTYWHLATRPDELEALDDQRLKAAAERIDRCLREGPYQTIVHGDAKLANFCFSASGDDVAAVDFQYVGGGCGMQDVAYFISSCLDEEQCERHEERLLASYFRSLGEALIGLERDVDPAAVERSWRALYPVAWADFYRFLKGWSPGHWKMHRYSERLTQEVLAQLSSQAERSLESNHPRARSALG
jgi:hypothetical protein